MRRARNGLRPIGWWMLLMLALGPVSGGAQANAPVPERAIDDGDISKVKAWLDKGGKVNERGLFNQTALMYAAGHGRLEIVKLLLSRRADPNLRKEESGPGITVLWQVNGSEKLANLTGERQAAMISALIDAGADPLVVAEGHGSPTPLFEAVQNQAGRVDGNLEAVRALLARGAGQNVNARGYEGRTALYHAVKGLNREMVALILTAKPDLGVRYSLANGNILYFATQVASAEIVKLLVDAGADVNAADKDGFTPLMSAAGRMDADIVNCLLEHGADFRLKSRAGFTALGLANRRGRSNRLVIELLTKAGAAE